MMDAIIQFIVLTVLVLLVSILLYYKNAFNHWQKLGVPHLKPSFPFGNLDSQFTKYFGKRVGDIYSEMKKSGSSFCGYYMFAMPVFVPISPDLVKLVLTNNFESFDDRGFHSDEKNDPMAVSIITTSGERWKDMRTTFSPTFTSAKVKTMFPIMVACSNDLENVIDDATKKSEPIDMYDVSTRYAIDVICSVAFGIEGNSLKNPNSEFRKYGLMIFNNDILNNIRVSLGFTAPTLLKLFKINLFDPTVTKFFHKVVKDMVAYRESNNIHKKDLMDMLIRLKNNDNFDDDVSRFVKVVNSKSVDMTVDQIAAHCFFFFFVGFESPAATINFCMFELAVNPNIQDKVRAEITSVLKKYNGDMTYDAISELRYLDQVFNETLRKYPVLHTLNRLCTKDFRIPETNITIKKGTRADISVLGVHMDPEFYPDPEKFDPERFTDEEISKRPSYTYLPFGEGPRICLGMKFGIVESKIAIIRMIKDFKFFLHPKIKLPLELRSVGPIICVEEPILLLTEKIENTIFLNHP